jgi:hypothetical protein
MRRVRTLMLAMILPVTLSGCVAAIIPIVAAGTMAKKQVDKKKRERVVQAPAKTPAAPPVAANVPLRNVEQKAVEETASLSPLLSASDETAVAATDANPFIGFALEKAAQRRAGEAFSSALLVKNVALYKPEFLPCDDRPLAVMIDVDDADAADNTPAQPDFAAGLAKLRQAEIEIIWVSERRAEARDELLSRLQDTRLMPDQPDTLILSRGRGDRKQLERLDAAAGRCVVALLGDKRSDFDELFDFLRSEDNGFALDRMWGKGWFVSNAPLFANDQTAQSGKELNALDPR